MKSRAKNGIDNNICLIDEVLKFVTRRTDKHVNATTSRTTCNMTSKRSRNLIRFNGSHNIDRDVLVGQNVSCNPTVTTVVTKTAKNDSMLRIEFFNLGCGKFARKLHEFGFRCTCLFYQVFKMTNLITAQNGFHLYTPMFDNRNTGRIGNFRILDTLKLIQDRPGLFK